ncbi:MAG: hypothetical protein FJX80_12030 [Bacteroidetes bacterium]|jgi:hypothetical protein|nr:hypothetical protein [Bacteroidota bacterium]
MNLNLDQVDYVTLNLMVNQQQYDRYLRTQEQRMNEKFEKAKKFYKKRIVETTRNCLKGEMTNDIFVNQAFDAYAKACIVYFRNKDKNDTLQEEYIEECNMIGFLPCINEAEEEEEEGEPEFLENDKTIKNLELIITNEKYKPGPPTLDTYVIKKTAYVPMREIIPKHKEINLDDPRFKTKDIKIKSQTGQGIQNHVTNPNIKPDKIQEKL